LDGGVGETSHSAVRATSISQRYDGSFTEVQQFFPIGTAHALIMARVQWWVRLKMQRGSNMFRSFVSARETATVFAGAFISALLLVSAATSLPIA
jgi:hypothetical protein